MSKLFNLFKKSTKIITLFVPNTILAKIASELVIWGLESLRDNKKSTFTKKLATISIDAVNEHKNKKVK